MARSDLLAAGLLLTVVLMSSPSNAFLTDDDKEELLRAHNFYRGKVSPVATNMAKLVSVVQLPFHRSELASTSAPAQETPLP